METLYKDYVTFNIFDTEINFISNESDYGTNIIAEVKDKYYHLGNINPTIIQAINLWQMINNRNLTEEETFQIVTNNVSCEINQKSAV